jgi:hypothetical protein
MQEPPIQESSPQETSLKETSLQETSLQETSLQEPPLQEPSLQETSLKGSSFRDVDSEILPPELESDEEFVWPWDEEIPNIHEFRLSVQSLLRGSDRDMLEAASEVLTGIQGTMSKAWAIEVMKEIFSRFGLEFKHTMYDEVATPRWSMVDLAEELQRSQEVEDQSEDELEDQFVGDALEILEEVEEESNSHEDSEEKVQDEPEMPDKMQVDVSEKLSEIGRDAESEKSNPKVEDEDSETKWQTPPQTPRESFDESCCISCSPSRFPGGHALSRSIPTPPTSPPAFIFQPNSTVRSETTFDSSTPSASIIPETPKKSFTISIFSNLKKRFRRTSKKLRISIIGRVRPATPEQEPSHPSPQQALSKHPLVDKVNEDPQTVLRGPTLKLNRMSDIIVPLTDEERSEIDRRRARESKLTEDFDLVVRLGTIRTPRASLTLTEMDTLSDLPAGAIDRSTIPPIPMVEPEYLKNSSPEAGPSSASEGLSRSDSNRIPPRRRLNVLNRRTTLPAKKDELQPQPPRPIRNLLSENNLKILNSRMGPRLPPIHGSPIPSVIRPSTASSRRKKVPSERSMSISDRMASSLAAGPRRRPSQGRRYPSMDYFPLAQTTALGLMGGRIGVVQMGSAYKANKILGDVVLLVPENQTPKRRRRSLHRYVSSPIPPSSRGSITKVERLRGEKLPVEPLIRSRRPSMASRRASMDYIMEGMEDGPMRSNNYTKPMEQRRPSVDLRRSNTDRSGRSGTEDQRTSMDFNRPKSNGAVWII